MYPKAPAYATREEIRKCEDFVDDVSCFRVTNVRTALERALANKPDAIILATGKVVDETFVADVMETRKDNSARIYCLSMGEKASATAMQEIATKTGGVFRLIPREELQSVTR